MRTGGLCWLSQFPGNCRKVVLPSEIKKNLGGEMRGQL